VLFTVPREVLTKGQARGGKYYRRTPTGNPKRPWRYYYTRKQYEQEHGAKAHVSGGEAQQARQTSNAHPIQQEDTVPPPKGYPTVPAKPSKDEARVGLCGSCVSPPQPIPRLPNLTVEERSAEHRFATAFETHPEELVDFYLKKLKSGEIGDAPNVFSTDDAKLLSPDYNPAGKSDEEIRDARSTLNLAVHQTANAVAKRAFMKHLDTLQSLPEGHPHKTVLITSGGVASGKGYALGNVDEASSIAKTVGAVWDAAGEQNATENEWVHSELTKRGLNGVFVYVDSDPTDTWENPQRGVIERAGKKGRMVDARLFADSYAEGAKNFKAFHDKYKDKTQFLILQNRGKPHLVNEMPQEAFVNGDALYKRASKVIDEKTDIRPAVRRGASIGRRVWGPP